MHYIFTFASVLVVYTVISLKDDCFVPRKGPAKLVHIFFVNALTWLVELLFYCYVACLAFKWTH